MQTTQHLSGRRAFSLIELMAVVAVIAILGAMAIPSYHARVLRQQVDEAIPLADVAKQKVALAWATTQKLPGDNLSAGAPEAGKIVNNFVSAVTVSDGGAVTITFGNRAAKPLQGKFLTYRPAVVADTPQVPLTWVCAKADGPNGMQVSGADKTTVEPAFLPLICQARAKGA